MLAEQAPSMIEAVESLIVALTGGFLPDPRDLRQWAARHHALPVVFDMGGVFAIRPSGSVISFAWDRPDDLTEEHDERIRNLVFAEAAEIYAELKSLRPVRPATAVTCPGCRGNGRPTGVPDHITNVGCYCGGLGWIPGDDRHAGEEWG
jgi:hypothetical protein